MTKGQRDTQIQQERDRKTKREEETGLRGRRRMKLRQIAFTHFSYIYLKQIFTVTAFQATGCEISPSAQAPKDLIQT